MHEAFQSTQRLPGIQHTNRTKARTHTHTHTHTHTFFSPSQAIHKITFTISNNTNPFLSFFSLQTGHNISPLTFFFFLSLLTGCNVSPLTFPLNNASILYFPSIFTSLSRTLWPVSPLQIYIKKKKNIHKYILLKFLFNDT